YFAGKTMIKGITFGGKQRTFPVWYRVPESCLIHDVEAMYITAMIDGWNELLLQKLLNFDSREFNPCLYPIQVDDYQQDHFQLHVSQRFTDMLNASVALHYTPGRGYYEEYRFDADLEDYGLDPIVIGAETISETDLVRRRWLDNDFYGFTWSLNYANT